MQTKNNHDKFRLDQLDIQRIISNKSYEYESYIKNKSLLFNKIQLELENIFQSAKDSTQRSYETATTSRIKREKYDTLGLESSYLAQTQSRSVAECEADLNTFKILEPI